MQKVNVSHVSKVYDLNHKKSDKLKSLFSFKNGNNKKPYYALRDISFSVNAGESVGIIGLNGSGKSTLSNLLAEVTQPTTGTINIDGRSSLIAISAGLNNEFTGEENIRMKCLMHGMSEKEINAKFEEIVSFSELGEFIKQPIKSYSSGMRSRLGFAIAINTNPDVLIVDEALSVGDETFSNKCIEKMKDFQKSGKTIFFVSHSAGQIRKMCDKALWIHFGEVREYGECNKVVDHYVHHINQYKKLSKVEQIQYKKDMHNKQREESNHKVVESEEKQFDYKNLGILICCTLFFMISTWLQITH